MPEFKSINGKWVPKAAVTPPVEPTPEAPKEEIKEVKKEAPKREPRRRLKPIISE